MKKILIICPFPVGVAAGQRLKYEQYLNAWREDGWQVDVSSYMDKQMWCVVYQHGNLLFKFLGVIRGHVRRIKDLFRIKKYDVVYVFMYVTPFFTSIMERLVINLAKKVIFDVEDNVLVDQNLPKKLNPNPFVKFFKNSNKVEYLIIRADHVITSSPFLNEFCQNKNLSRACTYISSSVDTDRFIPSNSYSNLQTVIIGWTGTYSSKIFLDQLKVVFYELQKRVKFKLKIIGNFHYDLPGIDLEVIHWNEKNEIRDLQSIDIGVYPLINSDWVLGKSGLKAIQYMAFGLPCVASEVGTTPMIIKDGINGRLVKTNSEWVEALEELVRNPLLRQKLGENARKDIVENYSLKVTNIKYKNILDNMWEKVK